MREGKKAKTQWFAAFVSGRPCDGDGGGGGVVRVEQPCAKGIPERRGERVRG